MSSRIINSLALAGLFILWLDTPVGWAFVAISLLLVAHLIHMLCDE